MNLPPFRRLAASFVLVASTIAPGAVRAEPGGAPHAELILPLESLHNHGSCIVECPNGDLLVCWFRGSGERTADDVAIMGARKRKGEDAWSAPFVMADVPGFPDTNCCMVFDPKGRLWLLWPTILAHTWESALMKYKISSDWAGDGSPVWEASEVLHIRQEDDFEERVRAKTEEYLADQPLRAMANIWAERNFKQAADKLTRRLGWFTRAHPLFLEDGRMLVGLYSDGFSFSMVAITDDLGASWSFSDPIVGGGNIQPSFARRDDGTIVCFMRDNGPPPKRVLVSESKDRGETWSKVRDHPDLPNPGAGLEIARLSSGEFVCINNDVPNGRHSLAVSISDDGGETWKWTRHLERDPEEKGRYHYPSIVQGADGALHASYSIFVPTESGEGKSIKYARFGVDWVKGASE